MTPAHATACFFAGLLLANTVPHFVHGLSGDRFPSPFANPPGKGLSSPLVNVLWSLFNLGLGGALFRTGRVADSAAAMAICFAGIAAISIPSSVGFARKHAQ